VKDEWVVTGYVSGKKEAPKDKSQKSNKFSELKFKKIHTKIKRYTGVFFVPLCASFAHFVVKYRTIFHLA
jgi:hypothetical protein